MRNEKTTGFSVDRTQPVPLNPKRDQGGSRWADIPTYYPRRQQIFCFTSMKCAGFVRLNDSFCPVYPVAGAYAGQTRKTRYLVGASHTGHLPSSTVGAREGGLRETTTIPDAQARRNETGQIINLKPRMQGTCADLSAPPRLLFARWGKPVSDRLSKTRAIGGQGSTAKGCLVYRDELVAHGRWVGRRSGLCLKSERE